jgi:hypothetical protein
LKLLAASLVTAGLAIAMTTAAPAFAGESGNHPHRHHRHVHSHVVVNAPYDSVPSGARDFTPYAYGADPDPMNVYVNGRFIGRDPDPNVRQQLKNDYDLSQGGR